MTDITEHALEYAFAGILFCMAFFLLLWFHRAAESELQVCGKTPERMIMFEETEE